MQDLQHMTVAELSALTASEAPVPGGGSISAMAGAFAGNIGAAQAMDQVAPVIDSLLAEL